MTIGRAVRLSRIGLRPLAAVPMMCTILDLTKYIRLAETRRRRFAQTMLDLLALIEITLWLMDILAQYTPMDRMLSRHKTATIGYFTMTVLNNVAISRVAVDQFAMNSHSLRYIVSLSRWYSRWDDADLAQSILEPNKSPRAHR